MKRLTCVRSRSSWLFRLLAAPALAFCGFYVAKADTKLFNRVLAGRARPGRTTGPCSRWPTTSRAT